MTLKKVYLYTFYERCWHWLQAIGILLLLLTGIEIHAPEIIHLFGMTLAVKIHHALGFFLLLNAFLALFYHLTTGAIKQYFPEPKDFLSLAIKQALYYMRGIFKGEPHPFEKRPQSKLNPLQKITYLIILNILLPLQVLTGILMWGISKWPTLVQSLGGLPVLASIHSFCAWLFIGFILVHIYLTTTGRTPLSNLKAMISGWEEMEEIPHTEGNTLHDTVRK